MIAVPTSARPLPPIFRERLRPSAPRLLLAALFAATSPIPLSYRRFLPSRPRFPPEAEGVVTPGLSVSSPEHAADAAGRIGSGSQWCWGGAPKRPIPPLSRLSSEAAFRSSAPSRLSGEPRGRDLVPSSHSLKQTVLRTEHARGCVSSDGRQACEVRVSACPVASLSLASPSLSPFARQIFSFRLISLCVPPPLF